MYKEFNTIVLGGGGMRGIAVLGAIQYLYDSFHPVIKKFIGTSVGSMIAFLLAVGYTPIEIIVYICTQKVSESILPFDGISMFMGTGAIHFEKIEVHIRNMLFNKMGQRELTIGELYEKVGAEFICCTYNMSKGECIYLSRDNYPNLDCVQAIRMSSSIPIVFGECIFENDIFLDGGIVDNFPISVTKSTDTVFGCVIFTRYTNTADYNRLLGILRVLMSVSTNFYIERIIKDYNGTGKILRLFVHDIDVFDIGQTTATRLDLFSHGYNSCESFFKSYPE